MAAEVDDKQLLHRIGIDRDVGALGTLFERHAARFLASLRKRGFSPSDAEDIVQDCFLRLLGAGDLLARVESPLGYLWRMLMNAASDCAGGRTRMQSLDPGNSEAAASSFLEAALAISDPSDVRLDIDRCVDRAWRLLEDQFPERAQALEWLIVDELSGQEIAQLLHRSYAATREYLSQCRKVLRNFVQQVCPDWGQERS